DEDGEGGPWRPAAAEGHHAYELRGDLRGVTGGDEGDLGADLVAGPLGGRLVDDDLVGPLRRMPLDDVHRLLAELVRGAAVVEGEGRGPLAADDLAVLTDDEDPGRVHGAVGPCRPRQVSELPDVGGRDVATPGTAVVVGLLRLDHDVTDGAVHNPVEG